MHLQRAPTEGNIEIYTNPNTIERPYKEIALLTVKESDFGNKDQPMLDSLVSKAKQIGADAIILLSQETQSEGGYLYTPPKSRKKTASGSWSYYGTSERKVMRASAIVYEDKE